MYIENGFQTHVIHIFAILSLNSKRKVDLLESAIIPLRVQSTRHRQLDIIRNHLRVQIIIPIFAVEGTSVKNGDGKAKIEIETAEVVENNGIKPADLKKAVDAVKQYKADMIREWKAYFGDED